MRKENSLQRFLDAQETDHPRALAEVRKGRKQSHWMWYIFPQIQGLGYSSFPVLCHQNWLCVALAQHVLNTPCCNARWRRKGHPRYGGRRARLDPRARTAFNNTLFAVRGFFACLHSGIVFPNR